ncbi:MULTISPECIES: SDR family NAD(P)-dependent oxidoreductase [Gracilibacillus]|uniref:SDR family NAD(P)-dependent oxidoreductase n=1 Tax=Gracilibacillus TaxID=74385 RepID=UPI000824ED44|nr:MULTISPECIES: SDR family oxidoreductase [Gracilibacillus]
MTYSLTGKLALVTGGSRGLGKSISGALAAAGATVIVNYANDVESAEQTVKWIRDNGGEARAVQADVTDEEAVDQLIKQIGEETGGTIDILVNNATGAQPQLSIEESEWTDYEAQFRFFVKAPLLLTKAVLPGMKMKRSGRIINIGSEVVQLGNARFANYVTAKSAQLGMTRSWASELGPFGITVNVINPGFIPVEKHAETPADVLAQYQNNVPLQRMGVPDDIGNAIVFIAADEANFITGQSLSVNGGNTFGV